MIDKTMNIAEFCQKYPEKIDILLEAGMHCIGCFASMGETIEEACMVHGIDVDDLMNELNKDDKKESVSTEK